MNTTIGYILLALGILLIAFAALSVSLVLMGKTDPISFYGPADLDFDIMGLMPSYSVPGQSEPITVNQPASSIPPDLMARSFNLLIHLFLMGFLVNVGFKIASIGTQMVRPIVVKVNKTEQVVSPKPKQQTFKPAV